MVHRSTHGPRTFVVEKGIGSPEFDPVEWVMNSTVNVKETIGEPFKQSATLSGEPSSNIGKRALRDTLMRALRFAGPGDGRPQDEVGGRVSSSGAV